MRSNGNRSEYRIASELVVRLGAPRRWISWLRWGPAHHVWRHPTGARLKLNADSLDLRPNHRRSAGFPLRGLLPSASGLQ